MTDRSNQKIDNNNNNNANAQNINPSIHKTMSKAIRGKKQDSGLKRDQIDKFYTNNDIATTCIKLFLEKIKPSKNDVVIEPSAGNGAFSIQLKKVHANVLAYDIEPDHGEIIQQDYLKLDTDSIKQKYDSIHVVGNPPFGRQSIYAKKFIKKSAEYADTISFILPKSFKKDSFIKTFPLCFHLLHSIDLPNNSFNIEGIAYDVPCVFQIWIKKTTDRDVPKIVDMPKFITYVKKENTPDVSIRRVGVYAGRINKNFTDDSIQSHYFLQLNGVTVDAFIKKYNEKIKFNHDNTVGPKSLSVQELNKALIGLF